MLGEEFGHLGLDRLGQQGARSVAQHLGKRVGERPWLKQLDDVSIGHGVSLLCWRSGGSNTPTIRRLLPVRPSPTSAHSSGRSPFAQGWDRMDAMVVGIDVSKDRLDVAVRPTGESFVFKRTAAGIEDLVARLKARSPTLVAIEATGGFEAVVAAGLAGACLPVVVVKPAQV